MLTRRAALLAAILLLLAAPDAPARKLSFFAGGGGGTPITTAAYYVATTGNDGNAGTLTAPFLTLGKCQSAMQGGSTKTCYIRGGSYTPTASVTCPNGVGSGAVLLGSSDANETWSYYPPDGFGSASFSGASSVGVLFCASAATGVTVNGLAATAFTYGAFYLTDGSSNWTIENNTIHDMPAWAIGADDQTAATRNTLVTHNYIYNIGYAGIDFYPVHGNDMNGSTASYNVIINACTANADCGDIYFQDLNATASTGCQIIRNYLSLSGGLAVYLDDGASNCTVSGNIMIPNGATALVQIHGGNNNVFSGNIGDVSGGLADGFVFYQQSTGTTYGARGMTGNVWENNVLVGDIGSGGGNGYVGSLSPPVALTIADNAYWNYGAGGNLTHTGSGGAGSDSAATDENPDFTCGWPFTLPGGSPVYGSPVSFPAQPGAWGTAGFWGPPGLSLPHTGTTPSPPHTC
jgi:hypothetical protein